MADYQKQGNDLERVIVRVLFINFVCLQHCAKKAEQDMDENVCKRKPTISLSSHKCSLKLQAHSNARLKVISHVFLSTWQYQVTKSFTNVLVSVFSWCCSHIKTSTLIFTEICSASQHLQMQSKPLYHAWKVRKVMKERFVLINKGFLFYFCCCWFFVWDFFSNKDFGFYYSLQIVWDESFLMLRWTGEIGDWGVKWRMQSLSCMT